jgi:hypothetical protein
MSLEVALRLEDVAADEQRQSGLLILNFLHRVCFKHAHVTISKPNYAKTAFENQRNRL